MTAAKKLYSMRWPLVVLTILAITSGLVATQVWLGLTFTVPHQEEFQYPSRLVWVAINMQTADGPIAAGRPINVNSFQLLFAESPGEIERISLGLRAPRTIGWTYNETGPFHPDEGGSVGVAVSGGQIVCSTPGVKEPWIFLSIWNASGYVNYGASADRISDLDLMVDTEEAYAQYNARRWATLGAVLPIMWAAIPIGVKSLLDIAKMTSKRPEEKD